MRIVDAWNQGNDVLAYCIGEGIGAEFSCKEISINGKRYAVTAIDILTGLNGSFGAILKISGEVSKDIPHGPFQIVS